MRNLIAFIRRLFIKKPAPITKKLEPVSPEFHRAMQQAANRAVKEYWRKRYQTGLVMNNLQKEREKHGQKAVR